MLRRSIVALAGAGSTDTFDSTATASFGKNIPSSTLTDPSVLSAPNSSSTSAGVSHVTKIDIAGVKPKPWVTGLLKAMNGLFASVNLIV